MLDSSLRADIVQINKIEIAQSQTRETVGHTNDIRRQDSIHNRERELWEHRTGNNYFPLQAEKHFSQP